MPMKQTGRKQYRSMQGKTVDMDLLRQKNELTPAVGNAKVNARGDELGPGGKIVRTREQVLKDYYDSNPGVPDEIAVSRAEQAQQDQEDPLVVETEDDWVDISGTTFTSDQSTTITSFNFTGNFVWVRAKIETTNASGNGALVTSILLNN